MTLRISDTAPDFQAHTMEGPIRFHNWIGDSWAVPFSHPRLAPDGWIPVAQRNLATRFPGVYGLGDVAKGARRVAKAAIFAESAARVVAADIAAQIDHSEPPTPYQRDGHCYVEFGGGVVGKVEVNFLGGPAPTARIVEPSRAIAAEKAAFGATRRQRWFGLDPDQVPVAVTAATSSR